MYYQNNLPCCRQSSSEPFSEMSTAYGMTPHSQTMPAYPPSPLIGTVLPTGMPTGPAIAPMPIQTPPQSVPTTVKDTIYTPGYLRTQIGRKMRVEFLIGSGTLIDRIGTLVGVGASYILIRPLESDDVLMCDIYSIKFVTVYDAAVR
jgi:hypothetical protein